MLGQALVAHDPDTAFKHYRAELLPGVLAMQAKTQDSKKSYIPDTLPAYILRDSAMRFLPNAFFRKYFKSKYSKA